MGKKSSLPSDYYNRIWQAFCKQHLEIKDMEKNKAEEFIHNLSHDVIRLIVPEDFTLEPMGSGCFGLRKIESAKRKDLDYWWRRYATLEPPAINRLLKSDEYKYAPWWLLMDFYRWMADQMNEGGDMRQNWETIAYGTKGIGWVVQYWTDCHYSPVSHAPGTAQQVIDILGEDLLKKIFQIQIV